MLLNIVSPSECDVKSARRGAGKDLEMGGTHGTHGIPRYQISRYWGSVIIIIIIIIIIYLFIKHIHIDGRKQDSGTGQQGTHSTLTVGLYKACNYCEYKIIQEIIRR